MKRVLLRDGIVAVTLLAVALGGSVALPAQTLLASLAGLFLLAAPPRQALPRTPLLIAAALLALALLAFLPEGSGSAPPWRIYLRQEAHLPLPADLRLADLHAAYAFPLADTRTPQPWLTLQGAGLLFLGLCWALYLLALPWKREDRIRCTGGLVLGVAVLSLMAAVAFLLHLHVPGWTQEQNRGWFPNRNQTADVLALCGIAAYGLIFDRLRKGRRLGWLLLAALVPIVMLLFISLSRAGILLFFGGLAAYQLWPRGGLDRRRGLSIKWVALSAALALVLLAVFLTWGGETLARFSAQNRANSDFTDFRGAIQRDALVFSFQSPWLGVGLGNFQPLFAFSRSASINETTAIHPESDWLWLACEMGWPAVALVLAGFVWWLRRALPMENKAGESMRRALLVATIIFAVHGLVDVSAHRLGSLWVGLLIAAMALPAPEAESTSRVTPVVFRALGLALLALAGWWGASLLGWPMAPTTATLAALKARLDSGQPALADEIETATAALRIAPLDWTLYFQRGSAEVAAGDRIEAAQADDNAARALNPHWPQLALQEGQVWLDAQQPDLCFDAWSDGLRRAGPLAPAAFREMIGRAPEHSTVRQDLAELALTRTDFLLELLPTSSPDEARVLLSHLLESNAQLAGFSAEQRAQLFAAWWNSGSKLELMTLVRRHPEWDSQTWIYQARFAARQDNPQQACELAAHWIHPPAIPHPAETRLLGDLEADYRNDPDNLPLALELLFAQINASQTVDALATLGALEKMPHRPAYLPYLAAQLEAQKGDWSAAWNAWLAYLSP